MKREFLLNTSAEQLDTYARVLGFDVSGLPTIEEKVDAICERRERTAEVNALGMTFTIPIKRLHDKRVTDRLDGDGMDAGDFYQLMRDIVGDDQFEALVAHCTDEDGTVDNDAIAYTLGIIERSDALKNF